MSDFLHCNHCLKREMVPSVKYYLTSCEKVFCNQCLDTNIKNCLKCLPNKCRVLELNQKTKSDIQLLFKDITSSFQKLQKVEVFQKNQRNNWIKKLMSENKRLVDESNQQKQIIQNLENELKTIKTQMESRQHSDPFHNLFNDNQENQTNGNKSIFKDLFRTEEQNDNIFGSNCDQIKNEANDVLMNEFSTPLSSVRDIQNQYNSMRNPVISPKPLSPLQSIPKSKISVRPLNSSKTPNQNSQRNRENEFNSLPTNRTNYTLDKYMNSLTSISSPISSQKYSRMSTSTVPSVLSLSTSNRSKYLRR